jgi:release factor glutamine methyltransferase
VTAFVPAPEATSPPARWTVLEVIRWTAARFIERGISTPRLDAEILVAHALTLPRVQLYVQFDRPLLAAELADIRALIKRRQAGESVAYLVGKKEFWGIDFAVDARVLVPRPDTETLIEEARERLAASEAPRIADVGTGSGAIALTLAKLFPAGVVVAVDVSPAALEVARGNAERLGLTVTFVEGDLDAPLAPHAPFSLIAANLPYIATGDMATLPAEVKSEPALALDGGADGIAIIARIIEEAGRHLSEGGGLLCEVGRGRPVLEARYPRLPFLWLDTEESSGEVFWLPAAALA